MTAIERDHTWKVDKSSQHLFLLVFFIISFCFIPHLINVSQMSRIRAAIGFASISIPIVFRIRRHIIRPERRQIFITVELERECVIDTTFV